MPGYYRTCRIVGGYARPLVPPSAWTIGPTAAQWRLHYSCSPLHDIISGVNIPDVSPLVGCRVTQLSLDYRVVLLLATEHGAGSQVDATLTVETPFELGAASGVSSSVVPGVMETLPTILPVLHAKVAEAHVDGRYQLTLRFTSGLSMKVPRDPQYESWELTGTGIEGWLMGPV